MGLLAQANATELEFAEHATRPPTDIASRIAADGKLRFAPRLHDQTGLSQSLSSRRDRGIRATGNVSFDSLSELGFVGFTDYTD